MDQIKRRSHSPGIIDRIAFAGTAISALALIVTTGAWASHPMPAGVTTRHSVSQVPPYYVALRVLRPSAGAGRLFAPRTVAVVRATASGTTIATVPVPKPWFTFVAVSGEAGDRSFVLAAQARAAGTISVTDFPPTRFFLLTIWPSAVTGHRASLRPLPIPEQTRGTNLAGIAVSPDGSKLAVSSVNWRAGTPGQAFHTELHVFNMRTGAARTWQGWLFPGYVPAAYQGSLSWEANNRTLEVLGANVGYHWRVLLVDTAARGPSLMADSRIGAKVPGTNSRSEPAVQWRSVEITPDGKTLIMALEIAPNGKPVTERLQRTAVLPRTGNQILNHKVVIGPYEQVLWASPTGKVFIVTGNGPHGSGAGRYFGTRYTPIPWSASIMTAAW